MNKWRLPTRNELMEAYENRTRGFDSNYYWSSDMVKDSSYYAWVVYFYNGFDYWNGKYNDYYVRLVRDSDNGHGLKWSKDTKYMNWYEAQKYVNELNGDSNE